jgi:2-polyprenyl-3-methyl-5-hydroxy-6-metoxy-1,4-benzoquinol methylase
MTMIERNRNHGHAYRDAVYDSYVTGDPAAARANAGRAAHYDRAILPHLPRDRGARIVDLACGSGALLARLREHGYTNITGVDLSAEQVAFARYRDIPHVIRADVFDFLAAHERTLDAAVAIDLLEHLTKDETLELLRGVRRALRDGGRLVVQTCNGASPLFGRIRYGDFTHENAFTRRSINQAFVAAGLAPVAVRGIDPASGGVRGHIRHAGWQAAKLAAKAYIAVETGAWRDEIVSQNLVAVAERTRA